MVSCFILKPTLGVKNYCDILHFESMNRFNHLYDSLTVQTDRIYNSASSNEDDELIPLILFEKKNKFSSYREFVKSHDESINSDPDIDDFASEIDTIFYDDDVLKTMLNRERLVAIGDSLYLYYDDCITIRCFIGQEICDKTKWEKLMKIRDAIDNKNYNVFNSPINKDIEIDFNCGELHNPNASRSDCGVSTELKMGDIKCNPVSGCSTVEFISDEIITNNFSQGILRYWSINGERQIHPEGTGKLASKIQICFDPNADFEVFNVELKYINLSGFCEKIIEKRFFVSCQPCYPPNISIEKIGGNPYNIELILDNLLQNITDYTLRVNYGDGNGWNTYNMGDNLVYEYPRPYCNKDYDIRYSFDGTNSSNPSFNCSIGDDRLFINYKPITCCPKKALKKCNKSCPLEFTFSGTNHKIKYKLRHKKKKMLVAAKHFEENRRGNFKKRKTNWSFLFKNDLTIDDTNGCECNSTISQNFLSHPKLNRKKARASEKLNFKHYLSKGNEWEVEINTNFNSDDVKIDNYRCKKERN